MHPYMRVREKNSTTLPPSGRCHYNMNEHGMSKLTWYVSVTILKGMEVVHEFFHRDLEGLKQASVFKEPVGDLKDRSHIVSQRKSARILNPAHLMWENTATLPRKK